MKSVLVLLAPGCEEMEAVILIDTLRRGGITVCAAGLEPGVLTASRGVKLEPDLPLDQVPAPKDFDVLALPGGLPGTEALLADPRVRDLLRAYASSPSKRIAAICAAPMVLDACGLLENKSFTCYPSLRGKIRQGRWLDQPVVEDGLLITSQGPGTAFAFALFLLDRLSGPETTRDVAKGLLLDAVVG